MIYLTKFLAQAGIASRRKAEDLIRAGRVKINGERAELGVMVEGDENITVSGKAVNNAMAQARVIIAFNKPIGYTCTNRSFLNEDNIFSLLPDQYRNLIIAGRLDKDSRGLILLTNDGNLANQITHPRFGHDKKYLVRFAGEDRMELTERKLYARAKDGIRSEDGDILTAKSIRREGDRWAVTLSEGKKRHIRRLFAGMGLKVIDLQRVSISELGLGGLPQGSYKILSDKDVKKLIK
ncbi:rRNA pseudouridine synthase [Patescibacteria group bacterium]|nr:rRNA pseudouridine synthase [Patescibacteria group bacterium]